MAYVITTIDHFLCDFHPVRPSRDRHHMYLCSTTTLSYLESDQMDFPFATLLLTSAILILTPTLIYFIYSTTLNKPIKINISYIDIPSFQLNTKKQPHTSWHAILPHPLCHKIRHSIPYATNVLVKFTPSPTFLLHTTKQALSSGLKNDTVMLNLWHESSHIATYILLHTLFTLTECTQQCDDVTDMLDSAPHFVKLPLGEWLYKYAWNDTLNSVEKFVDWNSGNMREEWKDALVASGVKEEEWCGVCLVVIAMGVMKIRSALFFEWVKVC